MTRALLCVLCGLLFAATPAFSSVTISSPTSGEAVGANVHYVASASAPTCSTGVSAMGIYVSSKLVYTVKSATLNTSITLSPGQYPTVVQEWDNCGGSTYAAVSVDVTNHAGVAVSSPANGSTVGSPVTFAANATSSCASGVAAMGIYVANKLVYTVKSSTLNTSVPMAPGAQQAVVQEWDNCGASSYTPVSLNVTNQSGVTISSPLNGSTVSSPVTFAASASSACSSGVAAMGVYVANKLVYTVKASTLSTSIPLGAGAQQAVVQEWDNCGGSSYAPINLIVGNSNTGVAVRSPLNGSTVSSPVTFAASASTGCSKGVAAMGVYVANKLVYSVNASSLSTSIALSTGAQQAVVQEWDNCGGSSYSPVSMNVANNNPGVTVSSPINGSTVMSPVTFSASAASACSKGVAAMGVYIANKLVYTVNGSTMSTSLPLGNGAAQAVVQEWDNCGASTTSPVSFTVGSQVPGDVNIATWHMDTNRSGLNAAEHSLTPANVVPASFGKLFSYSLDGYAYAEPLLMSNIAVNGATHNVLYAATEHDSVYAFDADNYGTGAPLWHVSLLQAGEKPITNGPVQPYQGVTSTPVIDPASGTMYVVSAQVSSGGASTFRLNALDITTGTQKFGGPITIQAAVYGTNQDAVNGVVSLTTACVQRAALLLANGNVYIGFGGCHSGWLLAYNAKTLAQVAAFNSSPYLNGEGPFASAGGVWMGGGGPAADSSGNVYIVTGNGPWDGVHAFGDSVLRFNAQLQLQDYFTPDVYAYMNCDDADLASGGLLLIPGTSEALVGGKTGKLYLVNTANLGKEQPNDAGATQTLWFENSLVSPYASTCSDSSGTHAAQINPYENFGTAAYFNGSVYVGVSPTLPNIPAGVGQFLYSGMLTAAGYTSPGTQEHSKGTTPFISADGTTNGIVWALDQGVPLQETGTTRATLRAYPADNMNNEIYNSSMNGADTPGYGIKFTSPIVGNGKVYISTGHDLPSTANPLGELDVYGLK